MSLTTNLAVFIAVFNLAWRKPNKVDPRLPHEERGGGVGLGGVGCELLSLHPVLKPNAWTADEDKKAQDSAKNSVATVPTCARHSVQEFRSTCEVRH